MSLEHGDSFALLLKEQLLRAELPADPKQVVGRLYRFSCEHGSHHHILVGTVLAIEFSNEGGLELYVSNPTLWGERLISLMYGNSYWMAYVDIKPPERSEAELNRMSEEKHAKAAGADIRAKSFEGEFELL